MKTFLELFAMAPAIILSHLCGTIPSGDAEEIFNLSYNGALLWVLILIAGLPTG